MLFLTSLFRSLRRHPGTPSRPVRRASAPRLEELEGRTLPSVSPVIMAWRADPAHVAHHREVEHHREMKIEYQQAVTQGTTFSPDRQETEQERHQEVRQQQELQQSGDQSTSLDNSQSTSPDSSGQSQP
jgi:hypothetical protein